MEQESKDQANIEHKVMSEITSGNVKLRSKYIFWAEKFGVGSALIFSLLLGILLFSLVLFYFQATDNLWYLSFGSRGLSVFLESFPYALVAVLIISILLAGFILKKSNLLYRKPFVYVALCLLGLVLSLGTALAFSTTVELIGDPTFDHRARMFVRPLMRPGIEEREHGIAGRVLSIEKNIVTVQTPQGIAIIDLGSVDKRVLKEIQEGLFMIAVGERTDNIFIAEDIRIMDHGQMFIIRRGIDRRFEDLNPEGMELNATQRRCIHGCILKHMPPEVCFSDCR